jgi:hypothetical protein
MSDRGAENSTPMNAGRPSAAVSRAGVVSDIEDGGADARRELAASARPPAERGRPSPRPRVVSHVDEVSSTCRLAMRDLPETMLASGRNVLLPSRALNELQRVVGHVDDDDPSCAAVGIRRGRRRCAPTPRRRAAG